MTLCSIDPLFIDPYRRVVSRHGVATRRLGWPALGVIGAVALSAASGAVFMRGKGASSAGPAGASTSAAGSALPEGAVPDPPPPDTAPPSVAASAPSSASPAPVKSTAAGAPLGRAMCVVGTRKALPREQERQQACERHDGPLHRHLVLHR